MLEPDSGEPTVLEGHKCAIVVEAGVGVRSGGDKVIGVEVDKVGDAEREDIIEGFKQKIKQSGE